MIALDVVPPVYSVAEVDRHLVEWDGRSIQIRGWLVICGEGRGKGPSIAEAKRCDAGVVLPISIADGVTANGPKHLFGRQAIVEARVNATCRRPNYGCFDHATVLDVQSIKPLSSVTKP
jgi:hypothetical protein